MARPFWIKINGNLVAMLRENKLMTQTDLAEKMQKDWASKAWISLISRIESWKFNTAPKTIKSLATALWVTTEELILSK